MDKLSATFAALADPTRRAILARLSIGAASVTELARPFDLTVRAISKHVSVLERAGLVAREREAQRRPSKLCIQPLQEMDRWLQGYRQIWEERFDRIDEVLESLPDELDQ